MKINHLMNLLHVLLYLKMILMSCLLLVGRSLCSTWWHLRFVIAAFACFLIKTLATAYVVPLLWQPRQWAIAQLARSFPIIMGWGVRSWVQDSLGSNLPIKKKRQIFFVHILSSAGHCAIKFLWKVHTDHINLVTTVQVMTTFMSPPPAATFLAFHPQDNNIIAVGMEDSTIQIYNVRVDEVRHLFWYYSL